MRRVPWLGTHENEAEETGEQRRGLEAVHLQRHVEGHLG